jgi:hypothetical protein
MQRYADTLRIINSLSRKSEVPERGGHSGVTLVQERVVYIQVASHEGCEAGRRVPTKRIPFHPRYLSHT